MTVYISADAKNLREELASLRNQGGYEEQQFYFDGLVTNGTFDSVTTGWSIGNSNAGNTSLSSVSSQLVITSSAYDGNGQWAQQSFATVIGQTYVISFEYVNRTNVNGHFARVGGVSITTGSGIITSSVNPSAGVHTLTFTATATTTYVAFGHSHVSDPATSTWDNISVFETDGTDVVHRMPKGWVPKDVYEDGLLQREGAANDYEVVYDGFDYYVKPAVAPSATTQTCVIGVRK